MKWNKAGQSIGRTEDRTRSFIDFDRPPLADLRILADQKPASNAL